MRYIRLRYNPNLTRSFLNLAWTNRNRIAINCTTLLLWPTHTHPSLTPPPQRIIPSRSLAGDSFSPEDFERCTWPSNLDSFKLCDTDNVNATASGFLHLLLYLQSALLVHTNGNRWKKRRAQNQSCNTIQRVHLYNNPVPFFVLYSTSFIHFFLYNSLSQGATAADTPWTTWTWKQYRHNVEAFSKALISIGFEKSDIVNILGFNTPEWH